MSQTIVDQDLLVALGAGLLVYLVERRGLGWKQGPSVLGASLVGAGAYYVKPLQKSVAKTKIDSNVSNAGFGDAVRTPVEKQNQLRGGTTFLADIGF